MAFSVNGDFSKNIRSSAEVIDKRYAYTFKWFEFLTFEVGNLTFGERASIHVAFFVLERLALGDGDMFFIVSKKVAVCIDVVGAVRPAKGDIARIAGDAVVRASGSDLAADYRDIARIAVDAVVRVRASGSDLAADYRDSFITVDAGIVCASGRDAAAAYRDSSITAVDAGTERTFCGVVQNSALPVLPVNVQISIGIDSMFVSTLCYNLHLRTVRKDEMSVTAKLDLVRVFHLALHHVPAASEVAHVG